MDTTLLPTPFSTPANPDLVWAIRQIKGAAPTYQQYADYYEGKHKLAFATKRFLNAFGDTLKAVRNNRCPSVVDALVYRLKVAGFSNEEGGTSLGEQVLREAGLLWRENRMDRRQTEIYREAATTGDAYLLVWPDRETGRPTLYPNAAAQVTVQWDREQPGRIILAAKAWRELDLGASTGFWRLNLYYPDRVEKYRTTHKASELPVGEKQYEPFRPEGDAEWPLPYPWEWAQVPVFHFGNQAATGGFGRSELVDVLPLQDAYNKAVCDMLVAMEFSAFRQRWVAGLEVEYETVTDPATGATTQQMVPPFRGGMDQIWAVENETTKFGDFAETNLEPFLKVQDSFDVKIARVSDTPLHWVMPTGTPPSGESLKTAEAPFVAKVEDRQVSWGDVWSDVMEFCLRLVNRPATDRLVTNWQPAESRSDQEFWSVAQLKAERGIPDSEIQREAGYSEQQITEFEAAATAQQEQAAKIGNALATSFSRGAFGPN